MLLLGAIVNDARQHRAQEVHPQVYYPVQPRPVYQTPVYQAPVQSYYATPAAQAFQSYTPGERRRIEDAMRVARERQDVDQDVGARQQVVYEGVGQAGHGGGVRPCGRGRRR